MKNTKKIELFILKTPPKKSQLDGAQYVGGGQSKLTFLGHRIPQLRQLYKENFSYADLTLKERLKIWDEVFKNSKIFEVMSLSMFWAGTLSKQDLIKIWLTLKTWSLSIDNWAHSDSLCQLYAEILEEKPELILPTLRKWNRSKNPWLVRISMISLYYYTQHRETLPTQKLAEEFLKEHWGHEHYYVQKAIGWTLREYITAYPKSGLGFFTKNVRRVSGIAFTAASERLSSTEKSRIKAMRK